VFSYFDGSILAKYRVVIHLPVELGLPIILPYGEARSSALSYKIAIVEAITSIRTHKAEELAKTIFMSIPCGDFDESVQLDHLTFIKAEPEVAAHYLDRCAIVIASFYDIHGNMVNEIDILLAEYTDHDSVIERRSVMDQEA
jgi:hypothetical protein